MKSKHIISEHKNRCQSSREFNHFPGFPVFRLNSQKPNFTKGGILNHSNSVLKSVPVLNQTYLTSLKEESSTIPTVS